MTSLLSTVHAAPALALAFDFFVFERAYRRPISSWGAIILTGAFAASYAVWVERFVPISLLQSYRASWLASPDRPTFLIADSGLPPHLIDPRSLPFPNPSRLLPSTDAPRSTAPSPTLSSLSQISPLVAPFTLARASSAFSPSGRSTVSSRCLKGALARRRRPRVSARRLWAAARH
jgi:hypothetical protein